VNVAVVGHVEWVQFAEVDELPRSGEIVHALESWEEPAGGGGVAAVQLARLAGGCTLYTSLGDDELGRLTRRILAEQGVTLRVTSGHGPTRRAFTFVDGTGERTIMVLGRKLVPTGTDGAVPWEELARCDAVYFVGGDVPALLHARRARVLVATARELPTLREGEVELDALVGSGEDDGEAYQPGELDPPPRLVVTTAGGLGGWANPGGPYRAAPVPGEIVDSYGAGDAFAAGLTYALGAREAQDDAIAFAAQCGAAALAGRGAYGGLLTLEAQPE
jgi:ribokinase